MLLMDAPQPASGNCWKRKHDFKAQDAREVFLPL
jgi:hypothetical protein